MTRLCGLLIALHVTLHPLPFAAWKAALPALLACGNVWPAAATSTPAGGTLLVTLAGDAQGLACALSVVGQ